MKYKFASTKDTVRKICGEKKSQLKISVLKLDSNDCCNIAVTNAVAVKSRVPGPSTEARGINF